MIRSPLNSGGGYGSGSTSITTAGFNTLVTNSALVAGKIYYITDGSNPIYLATGVAAYKSILTDGAGATTTTVVRASSGIPFILTGGTAASNQLTMGANGALTTIIAQPETWPAAYIYIPAGKAYSGSAAGWYYAVFSSTTAATVYNNVYTSGNPTIPASPTAIVDAGPGAFSQTTATYITGFSKTLPGGSLGPNGMMRMVPNVRWSSSTTGKYNYFLLGGQVMGAANTTTSGVTGYRGYIDMWNEGVATRNVGTSFTPLGASAMSYYRRTVDTTADATISVQHRIEAGTEYNILEHFNAETCYGA